MELLSEHELSVYSVLSIYKLIQRHGMDYDPFISLCYKLPSNKTVYEIRLKKRISENDVKRINKSLVSQNLKSKIRDCCLTLLAGTDENRLEQLMINELTYKYGLKMDHELSNVNVHILSRKLQNHGNSTLEALKETNYGYKIYLNYKLNKKIINDLNKTLKNTFNTFKEIIHK